MAKVLQVGDICGIPQLLAKVQGSDHIAFPRDYSIFSRLMKFRILLRLIPKHDRIHFHYSTGLPFALDLLLWRAMGKQIIMHFHGSDIRGKRLNPIIKHLAEKIYVSTPDLLEFAPGATWFPAPIDLSSLPHQQRTEGN